MTISTNWIWNVTHNDVSLFNSLCYMGIIWEIISVLCSAPKRCSSHCEVFLHQLWTNGAGEFPVWQIRDGTFATDTIYIGTETTQCGMAGEKGYYSYGMGVCVWGCGWVCPVLYCPVLFCPVLSCRVCLSVYLYICMYVWIDSCEVKSCGFRWLWFVVRWLFIYIISPTKLFLLN